MINVAAQLNAYIMVRLDITFKSAAWILTTKTLGKREVWIHLDSHVYILDYIS